MNEVRNIDTYKTIGNGNPKDIAIVLTLHGIGDDISAMPAIAQKISEGFNVTVFCKPFQKRTFESLGCKVYPSGTGAIDEFYVRGGAFIGDTFEGKREVFEMKDRFGVIYTVPQWSVWLLNNSEAFRSNRIHLFATLIETTVPKFFSWEEYLKPEVKKEEFVLFAPCSVSRMRDVRKQKEIYKRLKKEFKNVVVFGTDIMYHYRRMPKMPLNADSFSLKISNWFCNIENYFIKKWNRSIDKHKILTSTLEEFFSYIYSAQLVVSADNGVMNTARALGIPTVGIFGVTPSIAADQYSEFNDAEYYVIKCEGINWVDPTDKINFIIDKSLQLIKENTKWQHKYIPEPTLQTTPALGLTT